LEKASKMAFFVAWDEIRPTLNRPATCPQNLSPMFEPDHLLGLNKGIRDHRAPPGWGGTPCARRAEAAGDAHPLERPRHVIAHREPMTALHEPSRHVSSRGSVVVTTHGRVSCTCEVRKHRGNRRRGHARWLPLDQHPRALYPALSLSRTAERVRVVAELNGEAGRRRASPFLRASRGFCP
jgi:hypothetical protein